MISWIRFIVLVYATTVLSVEYDDYVSLEELGYEGEGKRTNSKYSGNNNYKYQLSSYFNADLCDGDWWGEADTDCWNTQGISKYGDYMTRSLYAKDEEGEDENYVAIVVMKRGSSKASYSAILVESGGCHNGDNVLDVIDGVYWFFIACTYKVFIFSEHDIVRLPDDDRIRRNGYTFRYYVEADSITKKQSRSEGSEVYFSFISRYHGVANQYISGDYDNEDGHKLRLKAIKIDPDPTANWQISVVKSYEFREGHQSAGLRIQGATKIGSKMYLVRTQEVIVCDISGNELYDCEQKCNFLFTSCGAVLQGAETDSSGDLFVSSEWGEACDFPFWEIHNIANDKGDCYEQEVPPFSTHNEWEIDGNLFVVGLLCVVTVVIVVSVMTWMTYCSWKKEENYVHKYPSSV
eukprot:277152_1